MDEGNMGTGGGPTRQKEVLQGVAGTRAAQWPVASDW